MNTEPTITCPKCHTTIKLTESLAAPLVESARRDYEKRLAAVEAQSKAHEAALKRREEELAAQHAELDQRVAEQVARGREKLAADEAAKAKAAFAGALERQKQEAVELKSLLDERDQKLAEAQRTQLEFLRKQRELDEKSRALELTIEQRVQEGLVAVRDQASRDAEQRVTLKVIEKEQQIASMQRQIEELRRKAEQGSQQLQGEALEIELENALRARFPTDVIEPVPKGQHGGDVVQRVAGHGGVIAGTILWEFKRTKNWSEGWLAKLRDDQRAAGAELAVLVSQALPKGIASFEEVDGVWIVAPALAAALGMALRAQLLETAAARRVHDGLETKTKLVYNYLTGPHFKQRVGAIVEAFKTMEEDLAAEKRALTKLWARRTKQLERVMVATAGMYGDLQGIAGRSLGELAGLEPRALSAGHDDDDDVDEDD